MSKERAVIKVSDYGVFYPQLIRKPNDNNYEGFMVQLANIAAGASFTALTTLGAGAGLYMQGVLQRFSGHDVGTRPIVACTIAGGIMGSALAFGIWNAHYNPLPEVYKDLMKSRYDLIGEFLSTSSNFLIVKASERTSGKKVVLKMIHMRRHPYTGGSNSIRNKMLADEYRILSQLDSPHVVHPLGFYKGFRYFVIVLEHIEGPTLEEYRERNGPMGLAQTLEFALAIARGFEEIHKKGFTFGHYQDHVVNVILHPEKKAVLIDPNIFDKSQGPNDEMDTWASMVESTTDGWWKYQGEDIGPILAGLSPAEFETARQLHAILRHAREKRYKNYNELIADLEKLVIRAHA